MVETPWLGLELSGVVTEVAPDVTTLSIGDKVLGLADTTFASSTTADARFLTTIPAGMSFEEAASVPLVFLTAFYALHDLGNLQPSERVLIHAAAGGVGMAAVQLAQLHNAEVYGTGSLPKWDVLRGMGLDDEHIASSRTLEYREQFPKVDVILNALAREFVDVNFELLSEGGRFLEMGKTDIRDSAWVEETHPGVHYTPFELLEAGPERIQEMLQELSKLFEEGAIKPLPTTTYPMARLSSAFRFMAQAKHVGKVIALPQTHDSIIRQPGTVVVTGGLGAIGKEVARWLVNDHSISHLILTSRRGSETPGAQELLAELGGGTTTVKIEACDVADTTSLAMILGAIPEDKPLRGVIHAAGVLADGVLGSMDSEQLSQVLTPKVHGAWNLHTLTSDCDLDFCVFFSSIAGVTGAPGQGNYAAANSFLNGLASYRRALGLPGTSIAWGPWAGEGMAGGLSAVDRGRMRSQGMSELNSSDGIAILEAATGTDSSLMVGAAFDPSRLQAEAAPALFRTLVQTSVVAASSSGSLKARLEAMEPSKREPGILDAIREVVAQILGLSGGAAVKPTLSLKELGLDSLMAVELRNRLASLSGIPLPATLVFDFPHCLAISRHLLQEMQLEIEVKTTLEIIEISDQALRDALKNLPLDQLRASGFLPQLLAMKEAELEAGDDEIDYDALDDVELLRHALELIGDEPTFQEF